MTRTNKIYALILLGIIIAILIFGSISLFLNRKYTIHFTFPNDKVVSNITVYAKQYDQIATNSRVVIEATNPVAYLAKGSYVYQIENNNDIQKNTIAFEVKDNNQTINIKYTYNTSHLQALKEENYRQIDNTLKQYLLDKNIQTPYELHDLRLHDKGQWASGLIIHKEATKSNIKDYYRIIFNKTNDKWIIINTPRLYINKTDFSQIPDFIIKDINTRTYIPTKY